MIRTKVFILLLLTALAGCSSEYKHKELGKDCPKADEIRSMIKKLRADKSGTVIEGICQDAGLAQQRLAALRFMLTQIKQNGRLYKLYEKMVLPISKRTSN